jgi:hypothetical protein
VNEHLTPDIPGRWRGPLNRDGETRPPTWALPLDTTLEAARVDTAVLRRMGEARRAAMTVELCETGRNLARQGIRQRHPEYSERELRLAFCRMMLGDELFFQAFPGEDVQV